MSKTRLEAFTDAVIAILMTLLVLELAAPVEPTFAALWAMRERVVVYLISFLSLAIYWNNHHHLFQIARRVDGWVLWVNILFLLCLSLFPFASAWVDEHLTEAVPEFTYGVVVLLANICYALLARTLKRANGPRSEVALALKGYRKTKFTLGINLLGLLLGFLFPLAIIISVAASMLLWVIPERRIERVYGNTIYKENGGGREGDDDT